MLVNTKILKDCSKLQNKKQSFVLFGGSGHGKHTKVFNAVVLKDIQDLQIMNRYMCLNAKIYANTIWEVYLLFEGIELKKRVNFNSNRQFSTKRDWLYYNPIICTAISQLTIVKWTASW